MTDSHRCNSCKVYLLACREIAAKIAHVPDKELERQLVLGTMYCRKKDTWVQPLCFCGEWEGE